MAVTIDRSGGDRMIGGVLVVRASGASAARVALEATGGRCADSVHLVMELPLPHRLSTASPTEFPGCAVEIRPASGAVEPAGNGVVLLKIVASRLSIDFAELRPLMFQPVPVERQLATLFGASISQLLTVDGHADVLDRHGIGHYLVGLAELVMRSALRSQLHSADAAAARCREAIEYVNRHLADPDLTAERVADAMFISRRRLYQLFDDGEGISSRIRRLRIERAQELLADPTRARSGIGELSRQCGFVNSAHFSRTFRKIVGQTPREFRERSLGSAGEVGGADQPPENRG